MARLKADQSAQLERLEAKLGQLATVLILLELIEMRIQNAAFYGNASILRPALDDLRQVKRLVRRTQEQIADPISGLETSNAKG